MDAEARYEEVLQAALTRSYVAERAVDYQISKTVDEFAKKIKEADVVSTFSIHRSLLLPTSTYWATKVDSLRGSIEYFQHLKDEGERQLVMRNMVAKLVEFEETYESIRPKACSMPTYIRRPHLKERFEHHVADQVVVVSGRTDVIGLQRKLAENGQCLPLPKYDDSDLSYSMSLMPDVARALAFNLPHALEAQCGNWRDWVLGMTVVLADGTIVKSGSQAVKSVAGYDAHKLFVGSRDTLGVIAEVILKTFPISALPRHEVSIHQKLWRKTAAGDIRERSYWTPRPLWIQRTRRSDFGKALAAAGEHVVEADHASCTMWAVVPWEVEMPRYADDWLLRTNCGEKNLQITDPVQVELMKQAKRIFDPTNKLNPGAMGVV